jgi:hypothetical protein
LAGVLGFVISVATVARADDGFYELPAGFQLSTLDAGCRLTLTEDILFGAGPGGSPTVHHFYPDYAWSGPATYNVDVYLDVIKPAGPAEIVTAGTHLEVTGIVPMADKSRTNLKDSRYIPGEVLSCDGQTLCRVYEVYLESATTGSRFVAQIFGAFWENPDVYRFPVSFKSLKDFRIGPIFDGGPFRAGCPL